METWNSEDKSNSFKRIAVGADRRMMEVSQKIKDRPAYKMEYDAAQAKFYVYNLLPGGDFLSSREALLEYLNSLINSAPPTPGHVYSADDYERCWLGEIKRLIEIYGKEG